MSLKSGPGSKTGFS